MLPSHSVTYVMHLLETNISKNRLHVGFPKKIMIHAKYQWIFPKNTKFSSKCGSAMHVMP
jgi:hypothetical protein